MLQLFWADSSEQLHSISPDGNVDPKKPKNRGFGVKHHGHAYDRNSPWGGHFEDEYSQDDHLRGNVEFLRKLEPLVSEKNEWIALAKNNFSQGHSSGPTLNKYEIDKQKFSSILSSILLVMVRLPAFRHRLEQSHPAFHFPPSEDLGKVKMLQKTREIKNFFASAPVTNYRLLLLHSYFDEFVFGDGVYDQITSMADDPNSRGTALFPLTPNLCVFIYKSPTMAPGPKALSLEISKASVRKINELTQIYSCSTIFYRKDKPEIIDAFKQGRHLTVASVPQIIDEYKLICGFKEERYSHIRGTTPFEQEIRRRLGLP